MITQRFVTLSLVVVGLASCSSPQVTGREPAQTIKDPVQQDADRARWARIQPLLSVLRQSISAPGEVGESVREAIKDRKDVLFNQDFPLPEGVRRTRTVIASLFKNETTRQLLVEVANQELTRMSNTFKAAAESDQSSGKPTFVDEIVVGTGPEGAAYLQEKTTSDPSRVVLAVDRTSIPGGTFAKVGAAFALNSTNRKDTGARARPGQGDLNKIHDIVGLPDFKARRWVEAGSLGEVSSMGVLLSSAIPMFETEVVSVERNQFPGPVYNVRMKNLADGKEFFVQSDKVVFASGIGTPKDFAEPETEELIRQEREMAKSARLPAPRVEYFTEFVNRVGEASNRQPLRDLAGKDVLLVGGGDSGRVIAELLTGLGPESGYKTDVAQVGAAKKIYWIVGFDGFADCKEYIATTRARYSQIAQALNSGVLVPVVGRLRGLRRLRAAEAGEGRLTPSTLVRVNVQGDLREVQYPLGTLTFFDVKSQKQVDLNDVRVDKVILAQGFTDGIGKIVKPLSPELEFKDSWKLLERNEKAFNGDNTVIAREHVNAVGVFLAGPANESLGGLPRPSELAGVNANTVSIFANAERVKALAKFLGETPRKDYAEATGVRQGSEFVKDVQSLGAGKLPMAAVITADAGQSGQVTSRVPLDQLKLPRLQSAELALRVALDQSLRDFSKGGVTQNALEFELRKTVEGGASYAVEADSGIKDSLTRSLSSSDLLTKLMLKEYFKAGTKIEALKVKLPIINGQYSFQSMEVTPVRRR